MAAKLARTAGWSPDRAQLLSEAALVHDVGKIWVPDTLLRKAEPLTNSERAQIETHAERAARIVEGVLVPEQVDWIRTHHERPDGGGCPRGLCAEQIPEGAALLAVAAAWDVMTASRPYSLPKSPDEALAECVELLDFLRGGGVGTRTRGGSRAASSELGLDVSMSGLSNNEIADRLEAFAALLELADANPFTARAYRRAAETIRGAPIAVAELVRTGRARELRGIGAGIETRLRELVTTGTIAELAELERELAPDLIGLGRYLGLGAKRSLELARSLGIRTASEFREAAAAGRLRSVPGVGAKTEARLLEGLAREPQSRQGLRLNRAGELVGGIAAALDGTVAGDTRRFRDSCERLAVVCSSEDPEPLLDRFLGLPQIVAEVERAGWRAVGVTVEGVPVELFVAPAGRFGTELVRATGSPAYVAALEPLPDAADEQGVYAALGVPWCPPELREQPFSGTPPALVKVSDIRGDLHCHTTYSDGRASVEEMGRAAAERGYEYLAICDHTPAVGAVRGLTPDDVRRQGEEIAAANEVLAPFRVLRGIECDILPDGRLDLPDDVLAELDWVQASVHGGQRMPAVEMTRRVEEALRNPYVRCLSHPTGRYINRRPENALDLDRAFEVAREEGVALEVNGLPDRLDLSGEHVREALGAGVRIVCSTDAHRVRGLENIGFSVATARRGWATAADVVNTMPLSGILAGRRAR